MGVSHLVGVTTTAFLRGTFVYDFDCAIAARGKLIKTSRGRRSPWLQATLTSIG